MDNTPIAPSKVYFLHLTTKIMKTIKIQVSDREYKEYQEWKKFFKARNQSTDITLIATTEDIDIKGCHFRSCGLTLEGQQSEEFYN